jgi:hypothetical protein
MPTDLTIHLENRPGSLAEVGEALGAAGVNIEAMAGFGLDNHGRAHLVVDDADAAKAALKGAGIEIQAEREALAMTLDNEPGTIGAYARILADRGINIEAAYLGGRGGNDLELIVVVEDTGSVPTPPG